MDYDINKLLLNEPSFIVIDFYRTLNGIINQSINQSIYRDQFIPFILLAGRDSVFIDEPLRYEVPTGSGVDHSVYVYIAVYL